MMKQTINAHQLHEKLSQHKIWLEMAEKKNEPSAAAQLVLVDSSLSDITMVGFQGARLVETKLCNQKSH